MSARISRRCFNSTMAAGAAYTALNPFGAAAASPQTQQELCNMSAVELATRLARRQVLAHAFEQATGHGTRRPS